MQRVENSDNFWITVKVDGQPHYAERMMISPRTTIASAVEDLKDRLGTSAYANCTFHVLEVGRVEYYVVPKNWTFYMLLGMNIQEFWFEVKE